MTNVDEQGFIHNYFNETDFYAVILTDTDSVFHYGKLYYTKCIKKSWVAAIHFIPIIHCSFFVGIKSCFF